MDARNAWIRVVNAFVGMGALAELDEAQDRVVFGPLRDAEGRADFRAARRRASGAGLSASEAVDAGEAAELAV